MGNGRKVTGKNPKDADRDTASISHRFFGVFLQDPVSFPPLFGGIRSFSERIVQLGLSFYYLLLLWSFSNEQKQELNHLIKVNLKHVRAKKHKNDKKQI